MGINSRPPNLLEVCKLRDLLTVEHDLPTNAGSAPHGPLPVVLFEFYVVFVQANAHRRQRIEVDHLNVGRRRFKDDLELMMFFEAVGIFSIASIDRASGRLDISHAIRFRPQSPEKSLRVHRSRTHLHIVGLLQDASLASQKSIND